MQDHFLSRATVFAFVCSHTCHSIFMLFISLNMCIFQCQNIHSVSSQTSTSACAHSDDGLNLLDSDVTHFIPSLPFPFSSSPLLLFLHHMQRDKQSSGGRRLGPFSKDTFEMVQHVTDGYTVPCQVTPAACGQVYIKGRHTASHIP